MDLSYKELVLTLQDIEEQIKTAENRLDYATEELLIDSIIYELKSLYKKHSYYLRLCREAYIEAGEVCAV